MMSNPVELKGHMFSGLGNEILLVDLIKQSAQINSDSVRRLIKEKQVDFDQLISIEAPQNPTLDLSVQIFNRDGSRAENCINGARCLAKYVLDSELIIKEKFLVGSGKNTWKIYSHKNNEYSVEQKVPDFQEGKSLLPTPNASGKYELRLSGTSIEVGYVNLGNPHAVFFTSNIDEKPLVLWGEKLQHSEWFPEGVNLELAEILSPTSIKLRVFERGVGETLSCGSGACAAVVLGNKYGLLDQNVEVNFKKGKLNIKYIIETGLLVTRGTADFIHELNICT